MTAAQLTSERQGTSGAGAAFAEQPTRHAHASPVPAAPHLSGDDAQTSTVSHSRLGVVPDLAGFHELRIWADSFEDIQRARISCVNRMERGGVAPDLFAGQIAALEGAEHQVKLGMVRCYRRVVPASVRVWQQASFGIGEHLLARLLGALGHPRLATPYHWEGDGTDRTLITDLPFERTLRQLWSYCGHGDATRKRRKGMTVDEALALGSPRCKMLTHLLAEATIKCRVEPSALSLAEERAADPTTSTESIHVAEAESAPVPSAGQPSATSRAVLRSADRRYRSVYDQRRAHTATTNPDWSDGHSHNDALRIVGKHILADLWEASAA